MPILTFEVRSEQRPTPPEPHGFTASIECDLGHLSPEARERITSRLNRDGDVCSKDHAGLFPSAGHLHTTPPDRKLGHLPRRVVAKSPNLAGLVEAIELEDRMIESASIAREGAIRLLDAARQIAFPIPAVSDQ